MEHIVTVFHFVVSRMYFYESTSPKCEPMSASGTVTDTFSALESFVRRRLYIHSNAV